MMLGSRCCSFSLDIVRLSLSYFFLQLIPALDLEIDQIVVRCRIGVLVGYEVVIQSLFKMFFIFDY